MFLRIHSSQQQPSRRPRLVQQHRPAPNRSAKTVITGIPPWVSASTVQKRRPHHHPAQPPYAEMATTRSVNIPTPVMHVTAMAALHSTCRAN